MWAPLEQLFIYLTIASSEPHLWVIEPWTSPMGPQ